MKRTVEELRLCLHHVVLYVDNLFYQHLKLVSPLNTGKIGQIYFIYLLY
jgi:hypothetical protein